MPDPSSEPTAQGGGLERPTVDGAVDERGYLDVPEWVSELRRLYVEPKTRAKLRQEGVIAPQKRTLGLPVGRGSRRTTAPAAVPAPDDTPVETTGSAVAPPLTAPEDLRPAPLEPTALVPLVEDSGEPYTPPGPAREEKVASWLTSYLGATGHPTGDDDRPAAPHPADSTGDPAEPLSSDDPATVVPTVAATVVPAAAAVATVPADAATDAAAGDSAADHHRAGKRLDDERLKRPGKPGLGHTGPHQADCLLGRALVVVGVSPRTLFANIHLGV